MWPELLEGIFSAPPSLMNDAIRDTRPLAPKELRGQLTPGPTLNMIVSPSQNPRSWISQTALLKIPSVGAYRPRRSGARAHPKTLSSKDPREINGYPCPVASSSASGTVTQSQRHPEGFSLIPSLLVI